MKDPFISVIIPNYNHARFLDERIQSVLNQTYKNFEVIILDDKSTDNSVEVIEKFRHNPKIAHIIYNEKNSGSTFKQWSKGFSLAKGDYIWIAESDDSCEYTLLENLVKKIDENIVVAYARSLQIDENNNKRPYFLQKFIEPQDFIMKGETYIKQYLSINNYISNASSAIFRKDIAITLNPQYSEMKGEGDWLFWIEMLECGDIAFINKPLNFFRQHSNNTTQQLGNNGVGFIEHKKTFDYLVHKKYIRGINIFKSKISNINKYLHYNYINDETKQSVLKVWDRYYVYRMILPLYLFLVKLKKNKNEH